MGPNFLFHDQRWVMQGSGEHFLGSASAYVADIKFRAAMASIPGKRAELLLQAVHMKDKRAQQRV